MEQTKFLLDISKISGKIKTEVHVEGKTLEIIALICATMDKSPELYDVLKEAVDLYKNGNLLKKNPIAFLEKLINK